MEKKTGKGNKSKKMVERGSASSIANDLFGPKDSSKSSSSGLFDSVFGPSSTGLGRQSTYSGVMYNNNDTKSGPPDGAPQRGKDNSKSKSSMFETSNEREGQPCNFSSSIYYGGQDVYSPTTNTKTSCSHHTYKDEEDEDENGNNSNCASRGNWWKGSLYY